ncbi:hypothetical protein ACTHAM_000171 [Cellulomonas soli]|uniref:hypothetical protein n=1 Tax=Cellulomonas soli TaxID=931535 RepID=UPI003F8614DD
MAQGPLDVLLTQLGGGDPTVAEDPAAAAVDQVRVQEDRIAACMTALGFQYTPQVPDVSAVHISEGPLHGSREYVEQYGYGVTNPPSEEAGSMSWELGVSPDWDYLNSLTPAGKDAYDEALWGPVTSRETDSVGRAGGCREAADLSAAGEPFAAVRQEAGEFLAALDDDPAFAELDTAWSRCMADQGYVYGSPHASEMSFRDRYQALVDPQTLVADAAGTDALAEEELATARADLACQDETGYAAQHAAIAAELQQEWLDLHRAEVDAWVDAVNLPSDPPTNP